MEVEVTNSIALTNKQSNLLQAHSILNVLSSMLWTIRLISRNLKNPKALKPSSDLCLKITDSLSCSSTSQKYLGKIETYKKTISRNIQDAVSRGIILGRKPEIDNDIGNLKSIFSILDLGIKDMAIDPEQRRKWNEFNIAELSDEYIRFFKAIEKNSKGSYRIVYNPMNKEEGDYLLLFNITCEGEKTIVIPCVFKDVIRDLLSNARKYSRPGSTIKSQLNCEGDQINFVVEDNGIGIPEDEIEKVVEFGVRASNVPPKRTLGGGLGLTKAVSITSQFSGRMWIKSSLKTGTRIKISLPCPDNLSIS